MAKNIWEELLRKHTLEELKDKLPAEKSLEKIVLPSSASSASKSPLPLADSPKRKFSWENYGDLIVLASIIGTFCGIAHIGKRDSQYEFNGYIGKEKVRFYETWLQNTDRIEVEKEDGTKIIYLSPWYDDDRVCEVISVKPDGEEIIICDNDACLNEARCIAHDYKTKILNEKKKQFEKKLEIK